MAFALRLRARPATSWARVLRRRVFAFRPTSTTAADGSCPAQRGRCDVFQLGLTPFTEAWELQKAMQLHRMRNQDTTVDAALLLEHPPVYTLGRGASEDNIKFDRRLGPDGGPSAPVVAEVLRIERGGEVTYHGPGQLVLYPILNLNRHKRDLHWYMRQCEEVVIRTLADYGIAAARDQAYTGVWVGPGFALKIAAMGFSVSRWVTMHGLALNVDTDLDPFDDIVPCGIDESGRGVTSILEQLRCTDAAAADNLDKGEVAARLLHHFADVFTLNLTCHEPGTHVE